MPRNLKRLEFFVATMTVCVTWCHQTQEGGNYDCLTQGNTVGKICLEPFWQVQRTEAKTLPDYNCEK